MKNDKKKQAKAAMMQKNEIIKSIAYEAVYVSPRTLWS